MMMDYPNGGTVAQRLILATSSPRRVELLRLLADEFDVVVPEAEEGEIRSPADVLVAAHRKAEAVWQKVQGGIVIAADTGVFKDGVHFGKPNDLAQARAILQALSGDWHIVCTGLCLLSPQGKKEALVETKVRFKALSSGEIDWYLSHEEVLDKAGAYAIQGQAALFVERLEGEFTNVMGLPLATLYRLLLELGWRPPI